MKLLRVALGAAIRTSLPLRAILLVTTLSIVSVAHGLEPLTGASKVFAGDGVSCAIMPGGAVKCWGRVSFSGVGDGSARQRNIAVDIPDLESVVSIAGEQWTVCALTSTGAVKCWGTNMTGGLGTAGAFDSAETPKVVPGLASGVVKISGKVQHYCAVTNQGGVKCWGVNAFKQLGTGAQVPLGTIVDVAGLAGTATDVATSLRSSCALMSTGTVKCWGTDLLGDGVTSSSATPREVPGLSGVSAISGGGDHFCVLTMAGGVKCWGAIGGSETPADVDGLASGIVSISSGDTHFCALTSSGLTKCLGFNGWGQLGDGTTAFRGAPVDVTAFTGALSSISAGSHHTCGIASGGNVTCWGSDQAGQLGINSSYMRGEPTAVVGISEVAVGVATGRSFSCALSQSGGASCWGKNEHSVLGDSSLFGLLVPAARSGMASGIAALDAGSAHLCALTTAGGVVCAGANYSGQLGNNGSLSGSAVPVGVTGLASNAVALSVGDTHACALLTGGAVKCWGDNFYGQLGDGTSQNQRSTPVDVVGLGGAAIAIAAGESHTCAALADGGVKCWGRNTDGQLGDGTRTARSAPVEVNTLTGAAAVFAGRNSTCAVTNAGALKCWGHNGYGQLGDGTQIARDVPIQVSGLETAVVSATVGSDQVCAVVTGGQLKCWGYQLRGALGLGATAPNFIAAPADVPGMSNVLVVATESSQTCAVVVGGAVKCWGANLYGEIGDGTYPASLSPVTVLTADTTPNPFAFDAQSNVPPWSLRISNAITVSGIEFSASIRVQGGEYSIGCNGTFSSFASLIQPNQTVCVRHTAASTAATTKVTTLIIGGVSASFLSTTASPIAVARSDFNGDGRSDILWHNSATGMVYELQMNGLTAGTGAVIDQETDLNWKIAAVADLNGDGRADVVWQHDTTGQVYGLLMNGTTASGEGTIYTEPNTNWKIVGAGDFNADGRADLLWKNNATGDVFLLMLNGLSVVSGGVIYSEPNTAWQIQKVADFNGDGRADVLWRNTATGDVYMMLMNGTVTGGGVIYSEPNTAWQIQAAADFNGDGRADVLWRNTTTGDVYMMLMNGTTITGGSVFYSEPNTDWKIVATGDYNGDGRADILWRNTATGQVFMMLMNGFTISGGDFVYTEPDQNWKIVGP